MPEVPVIVAPAGGRNTKKRKHMHHTFAVRYPLSETALELGWKSGLLASDKGSLLSSINPEVGVFAPLAIPVLKHFVIINYLYIYKHKHK